MDRPHHSHPTFRAWLEQVARQSFHTQGLPPAEGHATLRATSRVGEAEEYEGEAASRGLDHRGFQRD